MFLLVLVFIVVPIAELYVIIQVGGAIGVGPTIALLLLDALLGAFLLRHQGRAAWVRFNRALAENRVPHKEVLDGVLVIFGGALLLTPGFITDIFGLILLIPPTRAAVAGHHGADRARAPGDGRRGGPLGLRRPRPTAPAARPEGPGPRRPPRRRAPPRRPRRAGRSRSGRAPRRRPPPRRHRGHRPRDPGRGRAAPGREPFGG